MTKGDPLRAQQIENDLTEEWWAYHQAWIEERNAYQKRESDKIASDKG